MIEHLCQNCIYKVEPTSIRDYFLKTMNTPCLAKWGLPEFKHLYWLCSNPNVALVDHTEPHTLHKSCVEYNFHGNCTYYRQADAEDIIPSTVEIKYEKVIEEEDNDTVTSDDTTGDTNDTTNDTTEEPEEIYVGDKLKFIATPVPFKKEAVTEERQKLDIDGEPLFDDDGNPVMETVVLEPEWINDQEITYKYQWYKNGRKLFTKKSAEIEIKMTEETEDEYYCIIEQSLINNGDGGVKTAEAKSNILSIKVEPKLEEPEEPDTPDITDPENPDNPDDTDPDNQTP